MLSPRKIHRKSGLSVLFLTLAVCSSALAQEIDCVDYQDSIHLIGHVDDSPADMMMRGRYLYCLQGGTLRILNVDDPRNPALVGLVDVPTGASTFDLHPDPRYLVVGGYSYDQEGGGISIVDVSDPTAPLVVSSEELWDSTGRVGVVGNLAVISRMYYGFSVYNIADPANLIRLDEFTVSDGTPYVLRGLGDFLYIGYYRELTVVDLSVPTSPIVTSNLSCGTISEIEFKDGLAYAASSNGIEVLDVSDPADPQLASPPGGTIDYCGGTDIQLVGDTAFISFSDASHSDQGLMVVDVSQPASPVELARVTVDDAKDTIAATAHHVYIGGWDGLFSYAIPEPTVVGSQADPFEDTGLFAVNSMQLTEDRAYIHSSSYLFVYEQNQGDNYNLINRIGDCAWFKDMAVAGDIVCFADSYDGLALLDVSNAMKPRWLSPVSTTYSANRVVTEGNLAFIGEYSIVEIADLTDPNHPIIGSITLPGIFYDMVLSSGYLYVANCNEGLQVIDVSTPSDPVLVATESTLDAEFLTIDNNLVALTDEYYGLWLVDVTDPTAPQFQGSLEMSRLLSPDVELHEGFAYIADRYNGIYVTDVRDPQRPRLTGLNAAYATYLYKDTGSIYIGPGLDLIPFQCPGMTPVVRDLPFARAGTTILNVCPNPFNPQTTVRFNVGQMGPVTVGIYDLTGRKVATLVDRVYPAGEHQVDWQGRDDGGRAVASGVYFVQVGDAMGKDTRKISLVR